MTSYDVPYVSMEIALLQIARHYKASLSSLPQINVSIEVRPGHEIRDVCV